MRVLAVGLSLLVVLGTAAVVHGQDATAPPPAARDQEGQILFNAGRLAYAEGRYETALSRFREALELSGRPALLYNIGQCLDRLRRDGEAIESFERYLAEVPDAPNRDEVVGRLRALRAAHAAQTSSSGGVADPAPPEDLATAAAAPTATDVPSAPTSPPVYEEWWFWTLVVTGVGAAVAIPIVITSSSGTVTRDEPLRGDFGPDGSGVVYALEAPF